MNPYFEPTDPPVALDTEPESDAGITFDPRMSPVGVFVCCAKEDSAELNTLVTHLASLRGDAVIAHFENIPVGAREKPLQLERIRSSQIVVVIITPSLLASELCQAELQTAFERSRKNRLSIVPVFAKACELGASQLSELALLPRGGRPISASDNADHLWAEVAKEVRRRVERARANDSGSPISLGSQLPGQVRLSLLVLDCSRIVDFGKMLAANLATQFLVTIRGDLADGAHRTHDCCVLCAPAAVLPMTLAKTAMQLVAAEEERSDGRIAVLVPMTPDDPFQEIPYLKTVGYDPGIIQSSEQAKLQELQRSAILLARALGSIPPRKGNFLAEEAGDPVDVINSMRRLWAVIVDLRDVLIELPTKIGTSVRFPEQFAATKTSVAADVRRIAEPFYVDAKNCGTLQEYERLVNETISVILNLPHYYDPLLEGQSWSDLLDVAIAIVLKAQADPTPGATKRAVEAEVDRRFTNTVLAFVTWWEDGQRRLRGATARLLDAIQRASLSMNERFAKPRRRLLQGA